MRRSFLAIATVAAVALSGCAWIRQADVSRTGGDPNQITEGYWLSGNGRYVYFDSGATNLVDATAGTEPSEQFRGIFRRDDKTERTALLRRNASLVTDDPGVSRDLQRLLIGDSALTGLQVWDRAAGTVARVDVDSAEHPIGAAPSSTVDATLSADGRFAAFRVTGPGGLATFVRDLVTGTTRQVTNTVADNSTNPYIYLSGQDALSISDDGSVLSVSTCLASHFTHGTPSCDRWGLELVDVTHQTGSRPFPDQATPFAARLSGDGRILAYSDGLAVRTLNRLTGANQAMSVDRNGQTVGGSQPSISTNGRFVAFSAGPNLVEGSFNGNDEHVYVRDRSARTTTLASAEQDGTPMRGGGFDARLSADGRYVTFRHFSLPTSTDPTIHWGVFTKSVWIPHIVDVSPDSGGRGRDIHLTISGTGFRPDAQLTIGHEGSVLEQSDLRITETAIHVTVLAPFGHPTGPYDVTVANPGGSWNTETGAADSCACYEVTAT